MILGFIIKRILILRAIFLKKKILNFESIQKSILVKIIKRNQSALYLSSIDINTILDWEKVPFKTYDEIEEFIIKIKQESLNTICKDKIIGFSKSSGTTSFSKFIPVSRDFMNQNYLGGFDMLSLFFYSYPKSKILSGKNFSLTGSYFVENGLIVGDISALLTYFLHPTFRIFNTPPMHLATISDWELKLESILPFLAKSDIRWIAGVPSWIYLVIEKLETYCNKPIYEIWPNFEVFFHGGISIIPFKKDFLKKFNSNIVFWQVYNASEGFFGVQMNENEYSMTLLPARNTYFEFLKVGNESLQMIPFSELSIDKDYELVITNNSGLYRYRIGDIIKIVNLNPLKFIISGRTKSCINAFGEELMVYNVEKALDELSQNMDFKIKDYTIAPVFENKLTGFHYWYIEFEKEPLNMELFAMELDLILQNINSDYKAKRTKNLILSNLKVKKMPLGIFNFWLNSKNKLNVQAKIPKLFADNSIQKELDSILLSNDFLAFI